MSCQIILLSYIQYRWFRIFNIRARNTLPCRIEQDCIERRFNPIVVGALRLGWRQYLRLDSLA
jgi:hypothetical protein